MITPVHIVFDVAIFYMIYITGIMDVQFSDFLLILSASLIDIDHLFSKPIYHPRRNPFKTHFLHKKWKIILVLSLGLFFMRPTIFLGIGIISHLFLDYLYITLYKIRK